MCVADNVNLVQNFDSITCKQMSWTAYMGSNLIFNLINRKFVLTIKKIILKENIEIGDPLGLLISSSDANENYACTIGFDNDNNQFIRGNSFLFHEYDSDGTKTIKVKAYSLSDPTLTYESKIDINVIGKTDKSPMSIVKLNLNILNGLLIEFALNVFGGTPYTCWVDYNDLQEVDSVDLTDRFTQKLVRNSFTYPGIYNVSVSCKNSQNNLNDFKLMYLPKTVLSRGYTATYKHVYLPQSTNLDSPIDLELPISFAPAYFIFNILDVLNNQNYQWTNGRVNIYPTMKAQLKYSNLKSQSDNYFKVETSNFMLSNYLISLEENIDIQPTIKILTNPLNQNEPVKFEILVKKIQNGLLKVDFGDGIQKVFVLYTESGDDLKKAYSLILDHLYPDLSIQEYQLKATIANHVSKSETTLTLKFESSLSKFKLVNFNNATDINQVIKFKLESLKTDMPIRVNDLKITFDWGTNVYTTKFTNYTFDKSNSFSISFDFKYPVYGLFTVMANCSNVISATVAKTIVKVGTNLIDANGLITNYYATVDQDINFLLRIIGGNGYNAVVDFGDSNSMYMSWTYLNSSGKNTSDTNKNGYLTPRATFSSKSGINITYSYNIPGIYEAKIKVSNPFGSLTVNFCSKITIQPIVENSPTTGSTNPNCTLSSSNLALFLNKNPIKTNSVAFEFGRGILNTFSLDYVNCPNATDRANLSTYWALNSITNNVQYAMNEYCFIPILRNEFELQPKELDYGAFSISGWVYDSARPEIFMSFLNYQFKVGASPLIVNLNNGKKYMELNWVETLNLSFYERTYDPDAIDKSNKEDFKFYFVCIQEFDAMRQDELIKEVDDSIINKLEFNLSRFEMDLAFYSEPYKIYFYEKNCFFREFNYTTLNNSIVFDEYTKTLGIEASNLKINETNDLMMSLQLYVTNDKKLSKSQQITLTLNASSFITISVKSDINEMAKQLDKLDNLAKQQPKKALGLITTFVDVINTKAGDMEEQVIFRLRF